MDSNSVLTLDSSRDKDRFPKNIILIHLEVFPHFRTLVPYPLISDSDIFGDNLGIMTRTRGTSADTSASPCHALVLRKYIPTIVYINLLAKFIPNKCYFTFSFHLFIVIVDFNNPRLASCFLSSTLDMDDPNTCENMGDPSKSKQF